VLAWSFVKIVKGQRAAASIAVDLEVKHSARAAMWQATSVRSAAGSWSTVLRT